MKSMANQALHLTRLPAHNSGFGRWAFIEIANIWDAKNAIRVSLQKGTKP
jgi:hypothetical protein